ncbi:MAG: amidohydrolase family protein [Alphaproteobacteria bacterium]|nr:amidohydrolase family protein [Alphaproteobacteria bacterium]
MSECVTAERYCFLPGRDPVQRNVRVNIRSGSTSSVKESGIAWDAGLVVASPANAHDHGYGIRTLGFGCADDALESWIANLRLRPRTDPYLETLVAFGRLAKTGVGITMHCHNSLNVDQLVEEASAVVRAAGDVGIRLALSCPLLDHDPWTYGGPDQLRASVTPEDWSVLEPLIPRYGSIEAQLQAIEEIARRHQGGLVDVQYGPIGPQWCSNALLEAIAEASRGSGRRIHMHLLESPRQRRWLNERFPQGIVTYLDDIGFLSPRLAIAHGVQLERREIEILSDRGVQLVSNPSANLRLRSGVAPLSQAAGLGLDVALGLDGTGTDDDQDLWREMRLMRMLHGGRRMEPDYQAERVFHASTVIGRKVTGFGSSTDLTLIDHDRMCEDFLFDDIALTEILLTRMRAQYASGLIVDGNWVMREGQLTTIDFDGACRELLAQARADVPRLQGERKIAGLLHSAIRQHYQAFE